MSPSVYKHNFQKLQANSFKKPSLEIKLLNVKFEILILTTIYLFDVSSFVNFTLVELALVKMQ